MPMRETGAAIVASIGGTAAGRRKEGPLFFGSFTVSGVRLGYEGLDRPDALWKKQGKIADRRPVTDGRSRVICPRAIIRPVWSLATSVEHESDVADIFNSRQWAETAGAGTRVRGSVRAMIVRGAAGCSSASSPNDCRRWTIARAWQGSWRSPARRGQAGLGEARVASVQRGRGPIRSPRLGKGPILGSLRKGVTCQGSRARETTDIRSTQRQSVGGRHGQLKSGGAGII